MTPFSPPLRILYAIQGTGNGHVSRARDIIPHLQRHGEVHVLISGSQSDVELGTPLTFQYKGLSFVFGKKGGVDMVDTFMKARTRRFYREIKSLPIQDYDVVISDFEPVSTWACYRAKKPCIGLSHQAAVLGPNAPQPRGREYLGRMVLRNYAPVAEAYGFHFQSYDERTFTPVIRQQVRQLIPTNQGHVTVYLPAYDDERLVKQLRRMPDVEWQVFSKHNQTPFKVKNVHVRPVNNTDFLASMASSQGVLCGAGFETPAEAMFLGKKVCVIPMKNQFEQHCNAAALSGMGVPVIKSLKKKHIDKILGWIVEDYQIPVHYPDQTGDIVDLVMWNHQRGEHLTLAAYQALRANQLASH
jgi:uncharacterized protein (TIGR00661 family)